MLAKFLSSANHGSSNGGYVSSLLLMVAECDLMMLHVRMLLLSYSNVAIPASPPRDCLFYAWVIFRNYRRWKKLEKVKTISGPSLSRLPQWTGFTIYSSHACSSCLLIFQLQQLWSDVEEGAQSYKKLVLRVSLASCYRYALLYILQICICSVHHGDAPFALTHFGVSISPVAATRKILKMRV